MYDMHTSVLVCTMRVLHFTHIQPQRIWSTLALASLLFAVLYLLQRCKTLAVCRLGRPQVLQVVDTSRHTK